MNIEHIYNVGESLYVKKNNKEVTIDHIVVIIDKNEYKVLYAVNDFGKASTTYTASELSILPTRIYWLKADGSIVDEPIPEIGGFRTFLNDAIEQGNVFITADEAKNEAKRRHIHHTLSQLAFGHEFDPNEFNYYITYNTKLDDIIVNSCSTDYLPNTVYFSSVEDAKLAVKTIGEEVIKRDYFVSERMVFND